jgi:hypothetical protein
MGIQEVRGNVDRIGCGHGTIRRDGVSSQDPGGIDVEEVARDRNLIPVRRPWTDAHPALPGERQVWLEIGQATPEMGMDIAVDEVVGASTRVARLKHRT